MKKLLLLAVLALGVVACEKNDLGMDVDGSSINIPSETMIDAKFDAAFDFITSLNGSDIMVESKSTPSTAKAGDNGDNWLQINFFNVGTQDFAFLRSDSQGEACAGDGVTDISEVVYTLTATQLFIEIDGASVAYTVDVTSYASSFNTDGPDVVVPVNEGRTLAAAASHNVIITL